MLKKKNSFFLQYRATLRFVRKVRGEDFSQAKSYIARDEVCRLLAAECYGLAKKFAREDEQKLSLQYIKLAAKLLGLSLKPKKLSDLDEIKKAINRMKEKGTEPNLEKSSG